MAFVVVLVRIAVIQLRKASVLGERLLARHAGSEEHHDVLAVLFGSLEVAIVEVIEGLKLSGVLLARLYVRL